MDTGSQNIQLPFHGMGNCQLAILWERMSATSDVPVRITHDDVIKWKHFPRYWPFVRVNHRSQLDSPHKGLWRGDLVLSLICAWTNGWANKRNDGDLRCQSAHYDVTVMRYNIYVIYSYVFRNSLKSPPVDHAWLLLLGMSYRFRGSNLCGLDLMENSTEESPALNDGDLSTCESLFEAADSVVFGSFFVQPRFGAFYVVIRGSGLECSPAFGMTVAVVSVNQQLNICAGHDSRSGRWCRYMCTCRDVDGCGHITVRGVKTKYGVADIKICEIAYWLILYMGQFTKLRLSWYLVLISKPGNKTAIVSWPYPYVYGSWRKVKS